MRKTILLLLLILGTAAGYTQQLTPSILGTAGTKGSAGAIQFEFSLGEMATTTIGNSPVLTQGFLQPLLLAVNAPLPVTGLDLQVNRLNPQQVQLRWTTLQENNNKGFTVERKIETASGFAAIRFVPSATAGGNSTSALSYQHMDTNTFAGRSWYRIRQEDFNGQTSYSLIRMVDGQATKTVLLKAWPVPAPKEFSVILAGIEKDNLLIFEANGRLVRTLPVTEGVALKITGLLPGTYLLRLQQQPDLSQKIIVQ